MRTQNKDHLALTEAYKAIYTENWWEEEPTNQAEPEATAAVPEETPEQEQQADDQAQQAARELAPEEAENAAEKVWEIAEGYMPYLESKIAKLDRKAAKLGSEPIELERVGEKFVTIEDKGGNKYTVKIIQVKLHGEAPKLKDWEFVATVEHHQTGNLIYKAPNIKLSTPLTTIFKNDPPTCDQCNTKRDRLETFLVRKVVDGVPSAGKRVGRTCLKDFLGGADPTKYIAYARHLTGLIGLLTELQAAGHTGEHRGRQMEVPRYISSLGLLQQVAHYYYTIGWISAAKARETGRTSTVAEALADLTGARPREGDRAPAPDGTAKELGENTLKWVREELPAKIQDIQNKVQQGTATNFERNGIDYYNNLVTALTGDYLSYRAARIAGSAIVAYLKEKEWATRRQAANQPARSNEWIGQQEGEKVTDLDLVFKGESTFNGPYGVGYIIRFEDLQGNKASWFTSAPSGLKPGEQVKVNATIKKHSYYPQESQNKQTLLTRVKIK